MLIGPRSIHTFTASSARRWGLQSRVTLCNKTGEPVHVQAMVRDPNGQVLGDVDVGDLPAGQTLQQAFSDLASQVDAPPEAELVATWSLVPKTMVRSSEVEVPVIEIFRRVGAQDHHIEHSDGAYTFGVHYQTVPLNDSRFHPDFSFLMQAPKVFLGEGRDTVFQVMHPSTDPSYRRDGRLSCRLRSPDGRIVHSWDVSVPAQGMVYVDVKEELDRSGVGIANATDAHGFCLLEAWSTQSSFLPLTFNLDARHRSFALEHSLPPSYYGADIRSARKKVLAREAAGGAPNPR